MRIDSSIPTTPAALQRARTPEEASQQFEEVLVKQFVQQMTKDLFKPMDGEGASFVAAQADIQRDTLNDVLTRHLVDSGSFGVSRMLERQWTLEGRISPDDHATSR